MRSTWAWKSQLTCPLVMFILDRLRHWPSTGTAAFTPSDTEVSKRRGTPIELVLKIRTEISVQLSGTGFDVGCPSRARPLPRVRRGWTGGYGLACADPFHGAVFEELFFPDRHMVFNAVHKF